MTDATNASARIADEDEYTVNNIYVTVQGEGALTGTPMILLRLHNCPVGCPFCDTKYTWGKYAVATDALTSESKNDAAYVDAASTESWRGENERWTRMSAQDIAIMCAQMNPLAVKWVMLTGGEPALQNLGPLVDAIKQRGFSVNLETSGTANIHRHLHEIDWVCVSPKIGMPGGREVKPQPLGLAHEIKFVIGRAADVDKMRGFYAQYNFLLRSDVRRTVQPMSMSEKATALCVELAKREGYCVSIQTHKIMGLD